MANRPASRTAAMVRCSMAGGVFLLATIAGAAAGGLALPEQPDEIDPLLGAEAEPVDPPRHTWEMLGSAKPTPPDVSRAFKPQHIFFPPNPPPLLPTVALPAAGLTFGAPEDLAPFVGEMFYAPLSPRLHEGPFMRWERRRLESYREQRDALRQELLRVFDAVATHDPAARLRQLETFAREQDPAIAALENEAEDIRAAFADRRLFSDGAGNWNALRTWRLGRGVLARPREENLVFEFMVMRAAPYFQEGLSRGQRRLLRETAMELEAAAFARAGRQSGPGEWIFFGPETAQVRFPAPASAHAIRLLERHQQEKQALKADLRDAIYFHDMDWLDATRSSAFVDLAAAHERRLEELETLAEEIRRSLAPCRGAVWSGLGSPALTAGASPPDGAQADARCRADGYRLYEISVFEPGLSPGQRRMLYSHALELISLPLPDAEMQPRFLNSLYPRD